MNQGNIPLPPSPLDDMVNIEGIPVRIGDFFPDEKAAQDFKTKMELLKKMPTSVPMDKRIQSGAPGGGEPDGLDPVMKQLFGG